jgi:hypothetical protein
MSAHEKLTTYRRLRERGRVLFRPTRLIRITKIYYAQVYEYGYQREARVLTRRHD